MTFVRIKKVKDKEYGYLVENRWTKEGPRQKVKAYLGRVFIPKTKSEVVIDFTQFLNSKNLTLEQIDYETILKTLIEHELMKYNFKLDLEKKEWSDGEIKFNEEIKQKNKNIVLKINQGLLCTYTIDRIKEFRKEKDKEAMKLAKYIIEAGIEIPKEIFVKMWEKK